MNRRHLLSLVPAAALFGAARSASAKPLAAPALEPLGFTISVQLWTFKEFTAYEAVEKAALAGAKGVEIFAGQTLSAADAGKTGPDMSDDQIAKFLDHCKAHDITPVNFGVAPVAKDEAAARKVFEFAKKLGLYGITTESLESLDTLEKLAQEYDLKVCIHNHPVKPNYIPGDPRQVMELIKDRHANIGFCADLGHLASSGLNHMEIMKVIAPRVHSFHVKDRAELTKKSRDLPLGQGKIPFAAALDEARKYKFAGNVSVEYEYNWKESMPEVAQCVGFLRGYAQGRG
jgi:sugar phosphate isomerase/epimerase